MCVNPTLVEKENGTLFRYENFSVSDSVLKPRRVPKETISTSGVVGLLQMVSESDTEQCASLSHPSLKGLDTRQCERVSGEWVLQKHFFLHFSQPKTLTGCIFFE